MCLTFLRTLAGVFVVLLTACTGGRSIRNAENAITPAVTNRATATTLNKTAAANKKINLIGPPEYIPDTVVAVKKTTPPRIIERGGKYVFIPPSYTTRRPETGTDKYSPETLRQKTRKIKKFATENNYDTTVAFFIDMQVKSGRERFFVMDLANDAVIKKGLVAHGKGDEKFTFDRKFSNGEGSNCSSLGIYKIGKAYNGAFGLSYKLYGLNKTNNNALKRYVVLHAMGSIPELETKYPITQTEGCPAVAPAFLDELAGILNTSSRTVLLYIYYGNGS
ncbi:MAG: murein L,D-transpeptidase catalytic domain-containing protein [Chitinophagaceae bacterium]